MEEARTIASLSPVARMHRPKCVLKNQNSSPTASTTMSAGTSVEAPSLPRSRKSAPLNSVSAVMSEMLLLAFITNRLMEYRPLIVKMPDRMG